MTQPKYVVGVGASAGGLDSLKRLVSTIPDGSTGLAFVIVQHLNPDHRSLMVELLQRESSVPVMAIEDGLEIEPDHVYIAPAGWLTTLEEGVFHLEKIGPGEHNRHPVDAFLVSIASDMGARSIGVVLSGSGDDGMMGINSIALAGGVTFAQDLNSAQFNGMPRSAISSGVIDYIMPPDSMVSAILRLLSERPLPQAPSRKPIGIPDQEMPEPAMERLFSLVFDRTGLDLTQYKDRTILRRTEQRMVARGVTSVGDYIALLEEEPDELQTLYQEILIGVTSFFRDREMWRVLEEEVIPEILTSRSEEGEPVRVWSAGCSTGEEVYSLGMSFHKVMARMGLWQDSKIFGTDINQRALDIASNGRYNFDAEAQLDGDEVKEFFTKTSNGYQVKAFLRRGAVFARQNVFHDPPFTSLDLVMCRNLLIYLDPELQRRTLSRLAYGTRVGGVLLLGSSETIEPFANYFEPISRKWKIYRKVREIPVNLQLVSSGSAFRKPISAQTFGSRGIAQLGVVRQSLDRFYDELTRELDVAVLVIDSDYSLIYNVGDTRKVLQMPVGKTSVNVFQLIHPALAHSLRVALRRVSKDQESVVLRGLSLKDGGPPVCLRVSSVQHGSQSNASSIIYIYETEQWSERVKALTDDATLPSGDALTELEHELRFTQESLQATIEELETANEELQATNEELLASNEALQSTNEELQSVNEELHTVNSEHQEKIKQLTLLNDDMDNLLRATQIGTIFLDSSLRIRKFTSNIAEWFHLMRQDIGRPIAHFASNDIGPDIFSLAREVLNTARVHEIDIEPKKGRAPMVVRLLPFYNRDGDIDGVVITFIDIAQWVIAERKLKHIFEALPLAAAFYDPTEKRLLYSSETFRTSWGMEDAGGDVSLRGLFLSHCDDETAGAVIDQILDVGRDITEVTVDTENGSHILHCRRLEAPASGILIVER